MSERRMFAKTIIDSDAFLDMPLSSQALYFHLSMRADDEGFINNPRKIQRMIGASDDDLKLLAAKNFIIPFESGVVVIKHWRIHNYIQKDRFKPTVYTEERQKLIIKNNNAYTLDTNCIQDVSKMETQDSIGKDSIGKDSLGEDRIGECKEVCDLFNAVCISYPKIKTISDVRRRTIKARLKTYTVEDFKTLFEKAEASSFLKGANNHDWSATFDWLIKDSNMAKVLDGNYDDKKPKNKDADRLEQDYAMISQWAGGDQ